MLLRRDFLNAIAAGFAMAGTSVVSGSQALLLPGVSPIEDLKWKSFVVETLPNNDAYRSPVVTEVSVEPNGNLIAFVGDDHVVSLYDRQAQAYLKHIKQHKDWVKSCTFSPDGTRLATAGNDGYLLLWDINALDQPVLTQKHDEAIVQLAFSPDGSLISTVGFCGKLRIYEVVSGKLIGELPSPCRDMHAVAYSRDGQLLAAGGRCGSIRVWETAGLTEVSKFKVHSQRVRSIEFNERNQIISASDDQYVRITDPRQPESSRHLPRHAAKLFAVVLLDENWLATAGSDNLIHIWQIDNLQEVGILKGHTGTVSSLAYGQGHLISGSFDTQVRIWNVGKLGGVQERTTDRGTNGWSPSFK